MIVKHTEKAIARLNHVDGHLSSETSSDEFLTLLQGRINSGEENAPWCIATLEGFCQAKAISTWFNTGDLMATKNWFYAQSKMFHIRANPPYHEGPLYIMVARVMMGLNFLTCDHPGLIK